MFADNPYLTRVYIPFGGVPDETKLEIVDKLKAPDEAHDMRRPVLVLGPSYDNVDSDFSRHVPNHTPLLLDLVVKKELERAENLRTGAALFVWAEDSVLQGRDPNARIMYATRPPKPGDRPTVEEIRASVDVVGDIVECVDRSRKFEECRSWAGPDGIVRRIH
ncbi:hypothetical protein BOTBODRAFT_27538 [Botryobasidium botryosum FD-172 SS1]|uniref:Uncharacterized protein n=1 Tax=Botryobasidium botryosum (strain FD-172 SS1) TaxID=930990 RepID=A0A067N8K8_BOTB1|nr:hypothetical protein BOTBODRAFT_27538 [Botryobasidium botryosum FD-172 SS1]